MATTVAPPRRALARRDLDVLRRSYWVDAALFVAVVALSVFLHSRRFGVSFWADEGLSVGISSHPLTSIPDVLRQDGSPPLYYLILHVWMGIFGGSEAQTHALSLLFATLAIPAGLWAGWSLFGRRVGWIFALLLAFSPFLGAYAHETRMYTLLALESVLAIAAYVHAYVYGRSRYAPIFGLMLALMLYTHNWGIFFALACAATLPFVALRHPDRRRLLVDVAIGFGVAAILYAPWLPTLFFQAKHTGAPWVNSPRLGAPIQISRYIIGGDRLTVALLLGAGFGLATVLARAKLSRERRSLLAIVAVFLLTLAIAWVVSQISPAWTTRYLATIVGPLLLAFALGLGRAGKLGVATVILVTALSLTPRLYTVKHKSDADAVAAGVQSALRPGDLVVVTQPEQVPLTHYYLPAGLRYANEFGTIPDPRVMNWIDALTRIRRVSPQKDLAPLVANLRPGQHVLLVRPITDDPKNWNAPWTQEVRRRSAQWGAWLGGDHSLRADRVAPRFYLGATTIGLRGVLYTKT